MSATCSVCIVRVQCDDYDFVPCSPACFRAALSACEQRVRGEERIRAAGIVMDTRKAWRDPDMAWTLIERIKAKP